MIVGALLPIHDHFIALYSFALVGLAEPNKPSPMPHRPVTNDEEARATLAYIDPTSEYAEQMRTEAFAIALERVKAKYVSS